jgi:hypothetical protein
MLVPPVGYPVCKKCNDGNLVPFYSSDGRNVYFCTNCKTRFSAYVDEPKINKKQIFLDSAQYISSDDLEIAETDVELRNSKTIESVEEPEIKETRTEAETEVVNANVNVLEEQEETSETIEPEPSAGIEISEPEETGDDSQIVENEPIALGPKTELSEPMKMEIDSYDEEDEVLEGELEEVPKSVPQLDHEVEIESDENIEAEIQIDNDIEKTSEEI